MDLILEDLNVLRHGHCVLELLYIIGRLVAGSQQGKGDLQVGGVGSVHHGGVGDSGDGEGVRVSLDSKSDNLAAPAELRDMWSVRTNVGTGD